MHTITLVSPAQGHATLTRLWEEWAKPRLAEGKRLRLSVGEEKRSLSQNALIHPTVRAIAKAADKPTDAESLRRLRYLLLEEWRFETGRTPMFERSLDGMRWVNVDSGTSDLDKPDCSEFIDWMNAWAVTNGVSCAETA